MLMRINSSTCQHRYQHALAGFAAEIASSNVTLLKAFFDENAVIPSPVQPDPNDPSKLVPYVGPPLTVGGELNKLALRRAPDREGACGVADEHLAEARDDAPFLTSAREGLSEDFRRGQVAAWPPLQSRAGAKTRP